ncbi:putative zinc-binding protein [Bradyrhizobium sp. Lot33]
MPSPTRWRQVRHFHAATPEAIFLAQLVTCDKERKMARRTDLPLVYSCSGCSSAAQLANHLAIRLDRTGKAEMSCIAGVGGDVPSLVRVATSGRPIVAIDGCALKSVQSCPARHGVQAASHYDLTQFGVKKRFRMDFDPAQADELFERIADALSERFTEMVVENRT